MNFTKWEAGFTLTQDGAKRFERFTEANIRQHQAKREADFEQVLLPIRCLGYLARDVPPRRLIGGTALANVYRPSLSHLRAS